MSAGDGYLSLDGVTWVHAGTLGDPLGFDGPSPADFDGLAPFLEMRIPSPLERALDILRPHLREQPLYRPTA